MATSRFSSHLSPHFLDRRQRIVLVAAIVTTLVTVVARLVHASAVVSFVISAIALAALAAAVGEAVEQLGERLGSGATGVVQAALGNLPELFVSLFALRAGLVDFVQASLVGSILANQLLLLGVAFFVGGLRNGTQHFSAHLPRVMSALMLLAVAALAVPTLASVLHSPAASHKTALSVVCSIFMLIVLVASIPFFMSAGTHATENGTENIAATHLGESWPFSFTLVVLAVTSVAAALVSDWFVEALRPAIATLHISEGFTGLVIVAVADNAVEHAVGVQLALRNKMDTALSVILNSTLQIAIGLIPLLVLLSLVLGTAQLTLVMSPLLVGAMLAGTLVTTVIVSDGESFWLEGLALVALYGVIATAFWWG